MRYAFLPLLVLAAGSISAADDKTDKPAQNQAQSAQGPAQPHAKPAADEKPGTTPPEPAPPAGAPAPGAVPGTTPRPAVKPPITGAAPVDPHLYTIGAEDILVVRVWREPELSGQYMVRPDGKISLPLVNELQAAGLTPEQLSNQIVEGLSRYMTRPEVTVAVQQVNSRKVYIQGEVQRPGSYPLVVPTTVLEALVNAGGFREFANVKKIIIMRGTERFKFNYKDVTHGKHVEQNIQLAPGDQIIVP